MACHSVRVVHCRSAKNVKKCCYTVCEMFVKIGIITIGFIKYSPVEVKQSVCQQMSAINTVRTLENSVALISRGGLLVLTDIMQSHSDQTKQCS